ncbi:hypothetical protein TNCV_4856881 [Trichonephila clavipes]|nr:hypothetical protein TNCV_4856881 [Trichonephila clavipes]
MIRLTTVETQNVPVELIFKDKLLTLAGVVYLINKPSSPQLHRACLRQLRREESPFEPDVKDIVYEVLRKYDSHFSTKALLSSNSVQEGSWCTAFALSRARPICFMKLKPEDLAGYTTP